MGPTLHGNFEKWEENEPTFISVFVKKRQWTHFYNYNFILNLFPPFEH